MNVAQYSIEHKVISWMFACLLFVGGIVAFFGLGQLEMPEFTLKNALVITAYPGASAEQVEEEVTLTLEEAIQQLDAVKHITSINSAGLSQIEVIIKEEYSKEMLPQVWDELRRKVSDSTSQLPPGVAMPSVLDDFGDVFGVLFNVSGDGYTSRELQNYADFLRRELILVPGVKKISVVGQAPEQVVVEVSQQKLAAMGIDQNYLYSLINKQNVVSNAGRALIGGQRIRIHTTGEFQSVEALESLLVSAPGSTQLVRLGDIGQVYKTQSDQPLVLYHDSGVDALSFGISFGKGVNVVDVGSAINQRLAELAATSPLGIEISTLYNQADRVEDTINGFFINLIESVAIVIIVLLVFMGVRSGLLMGLVLVLTIFGTFIVMNMLGLQLQLVSLGALIIALGMLVDNAIVVTEGVLIGIARGQSRLEAAKSIVSQAQWPLLGATIIGIIAFAPIGLSQNDTGEFCRSLFTVLLISLSISWITAVTLTPFFCHLFFKDGVVSKGEELATDPYKGIVFTFYKGLLSLALRHRVVTLGIVLAAFFASVVGFGQVKNVFFPPSNTPIFFVDVWMPEGSDILETEAVISDIEARLLAENKAQNIGIVKLSSVIGQGAQRFTLTYVPEMAYSAYGQLVIEMKDLESLDAYLTDIDLFLNDNFPIAKFRVKKLEVGPTPAAKLEARFYGSDPKVLRSLAEQAQRIIAAEPTATNIRHNWRNAVAMMRPNVSASKAREAGVSKQDIDNALLTNFNGRQVGVYRDASHILPIVARAPAKERLDVQSMDNIQVWSAERNGFIPLAQLTNGIENQWENPIIMRRDRKRMISVFADPVLGSGETADSVHQKFKHKIEAMPLPDGYELEWGGEYESSSEAEAAVFGSIPMGYLVMFLITVALFNSIRQPLVIWATVPLALIGMVSGLLLFDAPFSFMAMLGLLSLSGMVIKNGIVLVDQINLEMKADKSPYRAVFDSAVSRVRPVLMAAITTMLGMIPLVSDVFFQSMAITIIFGLGLASLFTLIVLPVLYTLVFGIRHSD